MTSIRAAMQRIGPGAEQLEPLEIRRGAVIEDDLASRARSGSGYRREYQVEHRGEVAVRGSIVDVFPSTADAPVRIDLWGDEVDRLTEFSVADQRSVDDLERVRIFSAREVLPDDEVRSAAENLVAREPWGREQWDRLAEGQLFDGMESWLPWLTDVDETLVDLVPSDGQIVLVEPRRLRDRATDVLAEEADLADDPGPHLGARCADGRGGTAVPAAPPALRPAPGAHRCPGADRRLRAGEPRGPGRADGAVGAGDR
ncbi:MAG: hypothetical protein U5R31_02100 [Acidimicrobiia bacterium]|nr:hypothetical protein [Acidimicrobiia bacterium]